MTKQLNEDTSFKISIKTLGGIAVLIFTLVGMWFTLQADIAEAKTLPEPEVSKMEFQMKDKMVRDAVLNTEKNVEKLEERMIRIEDKMDKLILRYYERNLENSCNLLISDSNNVNKRYSFWTKHL